MSEGGASVIPAAFPIVRARSRKAAEPKPPSTIIPARVVPGRSLVIPAFSPVIPAFYPVIPAKAGIQRVAVSPATRNQVQIPTSGSPLPLRERARVRVRRALARLWRRRNWAQTYPYKRIK